MANLCPPVTFCLLQILKRLALLLLLTGGCFVATAPTAYAQIIEICNNGIDDDGDNLTDCQDPDCPECAQVISCSTPNTYYLPPVYGNPTSAQTAQFGSQDLVLSTSAAYTTVRIRTPDNSYDKTVAVTSTGATILSLPVSLTGGQTLVMSSTVNTIQRNKGLIITSDEPVQVTYRITASSNQDIVPLKGRAAMGYAFYAGSQTRLTATSNVDERHFVGVMATQDNTVVTFRLPPSSGAPSSVTALQGISAFPYSVTLNANDTYLVSTKVLNATTVENRSVAGVLVTSNLPIVVNSGSQHNAQPYSGNKDAGIDQLVPVRTVGQDYVAVHGQNTTANSDYVFVVGTEKLTTVTISGPTSATGTLTAPLATTVINNGDVFTYNLPNYPNRAFTINTSKRAYTYHVSSYAANEFGMGILPTINPCNGSKRIDFFRTSSSSVDQAVVTIPQAGLSSLKFRGQPYTTYGTVVDNVTVGGVAQAIVSFANTSIASATAVNTITANERFHVGVVSNTGGGSTGNFGYYSNYDAKVDVLNPGTNQPDNFYTAAKVTPGQATTVCLRMTSCGTRNQITGIAFGAQTQSATFAQDSCITYTMKANAPPCSRDTIRVSVQNDIGKQGTICLEFVNKSSDLIINVLPTSATICQPTGAVSLTAMTTSSSSTYTYQWITPDKQILNTKVISATVVGRYNLSVSNGNGCSDTTSVVVQGDTPAISFSVGPTTACAGSTATYTVSSSAGTYSWAVTNGTITAGGTPASNSATVQWTGTSPGTVRATITSVNGCTATATQSVTVISVPTLSLATQPPKCNGGSDGQVTLTVTGGAPAFTYRWSNGATTQSLTAVAAGTYSVTVTNACLTSPAVSSTTVSQPSAISLTTSVTNVACNGGATGSIILTASGGTPAFTYRWSTGATTQNVSGVAAGAYSVTVTDANSCTATGSVVVSQPAVLSLTTQATNVVCNGAATGSISLTATGGTAPYGYAWNTGATTRNLTGLTAGVYSVTVTDNNGCTRTTSVTLMQPTALSVATSVTNVACNGGVTGSVSSTASGGTPAYTYRWSNGAATQTITGLPAGTYSLTVTDANSCTTTTSATVAQPPVLNLSAQVTPVRCNGGSNGSVDLSVSGGTPGYTYRWNTGATTEDLTNLPAGPYSVTVTDGNNCIQSLTVTVSQPSALPSVTATSNSPQCAGNTLRLTATGSVSVTYAWTGPAGFTSSAQNPTIPGATTANAGSYTVTVTDQAGCLGAASTQVVVYPAPLFNASTQSPSCRGATAQANGSITLKGQSATDRYAFSIGTSYTGGATSPTGLPPVPADGVITRTLPNPTSLQPYTVRLFNTNGCYTDLTVYLAPSVCTCAELCAPIAVRRR